MIILKRVAVRPISEGLIALVCKRGMPEVACDRHNERDVLVHAALLQRLGFGSRKIRQLLANHPALSKMSRCLRRK